MNAMTDPMIDSMINGGIFGMIRSGKRRSPGSLPGTSGKSTATQHLL